MTVLVETEADPAFPGRRAHRITGPSREAVQAEITKLMDEVEEAGGFANFLAPMRAEHGFASLGETITYGGEP